MKYGELTLGQIEAVVNKLGGMDGTLRFLRDELVLTPKTDGAMPETFRLTVDNRSFEQMIAAGRYDWKNDNITSKRFPVKGDGEYEACLFHFDRYTESEDNVKAIKSAGWDVGAIEHLLAFGEKFPEEQRKYPVIALGSGAGIVRGRYVPALCRGSSGRGLDLGYWQDGWGGHARFLAVREVSGA